eukprot:scaffold2744_cov136-Cylindrotheca_fusiformis.AAC.1
MVVALNNKRSQGGRRKFKVSTRLTGRCFFCFLGAIWCIQMTGVMWTAMDDSASPGTVDTPPNPQKVVQASLRRTAEQRARESEKEKDQANAKKDSGLTTIAKQGSSQTEKKPKPKIMRPHYKPNPYGYRVQPEVILEDPKDHGIVPEEEEQQREVPEDQVLTAYLEPIDQSQWSIKPLPSRTTTPEDLTKVTFPRLNSCKRLMEQWPVDDFPDDDPFLPWIHDVFPTHDGKFIQFVAQNKNRCHSGTTEEEEAIIEHMRPQTALFEHVPLRKINEDQYRLSSHEDADPDTVGTRFVCRFKPSGDITFSEFNNDYEWVSFRKAQRYMFNSEGRDNKQIHTSQLLFKCPVPPALQESIRDGSSVVDDWATIFVDVIPIRTPPRYGHPGEFLVPHYAKAAEHIKKFDPHAEWGENHVLPSWEASGRWTNIPVCKPSLMEYESKTLEKIENAQVDVKEGELPKTHNLVSCLWASAGYTTRGHRFAVNDGQRRLMEWISFNKILGWDHFYIYDNTAAFTNDTSLQPIADMFPDDVTILKWPSKVCNNNPNNVDSPGERSSQYAAESSCRLRFGPHVKWIGQFDIDEYLVPMGEYKSVLPLLDKLDKEGTKVISFASWRAWPRASHVNPPVPIKDKKYCNSQHECFDLSVKKNTTLLEAYNCDRQKPGEKKQSMPAEKQIYRADYVTQHFIHYSTVTQTTLLSLDDYRAKYGKRYPFPDPQSRFGDEVNEGLMLHSKAVAHQDTAGWIRNCHKNFSAFSLCRLGYPYPEGSDETTGPQWNEGGWKYNCYVNKKIDNYWAPLLESKLQELGSP